MQKVGFVTATAIVVANMIGTGVFTSLGFQIVEIKSVGVLLMLWAVGTLIALAGALSYARLAHLMPRSGGEYHFLSGIYHPVVGFLAGWTSLIVGFSAPVALAAMAMARYGWVSIRGGHPTVMAVVFVILISLMHSFNLKAGSVFQTIVTGLKILLIVFFIITGFILGGKNGADILLPMNWDLSQALTPAFAVSLIYVSYSFCGWNASVYIIDEIRDPAKNVGYSLMAGTILVGILYILLNFIFIITTPLEEMEGKIEIGFVVAGNIYGPAGGRFMAGMIALLLLSSISAMVWIGPRVTQVMGEDYQLLRILSRRNTRGIPVIAIWFQGLITVIMIITATFDQVLVYAGFMLNVFTLLTAFGVIVLRILKKTGLSDRIHFSEVIYSLVFTAFSLWMLVFLFINRFMESVSGLITIVIGFLLYFGCRIYDREKN